MRNLLLILFLLGTTVYAAYSQAALGISSSGILYFKDSVYMGAQVDVEMYIVNVGDQDYSGPLAVNFDLGSISFVMKGRVTVTDFAPKDSHKIKFSIPFNQFTTSIGSNIVVVWPTGSNIKTRDTITKHVKVFDSRSIWSVRESDGERVSIFPNPATHILTIKMLDGTPFPDHVIIVDSKGGSWELKPDAAGNMNVSQLQAGLYYLRLVYRSGNTISRKFVVGK